MGIKGLLQVIKPLLKASNVSTLRGKRVAIDGYCWLHKGVYGCCVELCNGGKSQTWIHYCLSFIDLLLRNGIVVTMVFDGANLPMKNLTENDREKSRQANLLKAKELMHKGDKEAARNCFARAVDVTPAMAAELIQIIKQSRPGVECIVAPYEADAQLAYLSTNNLVDCVVTEDSDTIPYGCKDIIFKLERDGSCQRLQINELYSEAIDKFDLRGFTKEMMLTMCILSGCDYLDSLKGMGLKTSYKHIIKHRTATNVLKALRLGGHLPIVQAASRSENDLNSSNLLSQLLQYELDFYQAILTFTHQVVYDPISKKTVHRIPLNRDAFPSQLLEIWWPNAHEAPELSFLGSLLSDELSQGIANGLIDPVSKNPFPSSFIFCNNNISNSSHPGAICRSISSHNSLQTQHQGESNDKQNGNIYVLQPLGKYAQALQAPHAIARVATISTVAQSVHQPASSSSTMASSSMKTYFASSSIRRYESITTSATSSTVSLSNTNSLQTADKTPAAGTIFSYFKSSSVKSQTKIHQSSSALSNRISSTHSSSKKLTSLKRFTFSSSSKSNTSAPKISRSDAIKLSDRVVKETATIDLSMDDENDESHGHIQVVEEPPVIMLDIYDATIITPEKACPSFPSSSVRNSNKNDHGTYTTSIISASIEMDNFTPASISNSSIPGCLSCDDTSPVTFSAASTNTATSCLNQSILKNIRNQQLSKFFKSPISSLKDKMDHLHTSNQQIHGIAVVSSSPPIIQDSIEIEQLADRLLTDGDNSIHSPNTNSNRSSPKEDNTNISMDTIDLYECSAIGDAKSVVRTNDITARTVFSNGAETFQDPYEKSSPLKRPSFITFSAKSSLERLQKQRITNSHYKSSLLQWPSKDKAKDNTGIDIEDNGRIVMQKKNQNDRFTSVSFKFFSRGSHQQWI